MSAPRISLLCCALLFAGPGAGFLLAPEFFGSLVGLEPLGVTARADLRSVFGGLELGVAAALFASALFGPRVRDGLGLAAILFLGMLLGRAVSLAVDGAPGPLGFLLLFGEVLGLGLAGFGLFRAAEE